MPTQPDPLDDTDPFTHLDHVRADHAALSATAHGLVAVMEAPGTDSDRAALLRSVIDIYLVGLPAEAPGRIYETLASLSVILDGGYDEAVVDQAVANLCASLVVVEAEYMVALHHTRDL